MVTEKVYMRPIAKSAIRPIRSTGSNHIVNTTIRLSQSSVLKPHKAAEKIRKVFNFVAFS